MFTKTKILTFLSGALFLSACQTTSSEMKQDFVDQKYGGTSFSIEDIWFVGLPFEKTDAKPDTYRLTFRTHKLEETLNEQDLYLAKHSKCELATHRFDEGAKKHNFLDYKTTSMLRSMVPKHLIETNPWNDKQLTKEKLAEKIATPFNKPNSKKVSVYVKLRQNVVYTRTERAFRKKTTYSDSRNIDIKWNYSVDYLENDEGFAYLSCSYPNSLHGYLVRLRLQLRETFTFEPVMK